MRLIMSKLEVYNAAVINKILEQLLADSFEEDDAVLEQADEKSAKLNDKCNDSKDKLLDKMNDN